MLYQQIVFLLLAVLLCNLLLNLRYLPRAKAGAALPSPPPLISVLVPARNEEENIRACLQSLQEQDYPNCEFLVLDDSSTDRTSAIISEMAAEDSRIRVFKGLPLPPDWAGKPFACYQLAREARGSWLLFTDADTVHAPNMLSHVLATALQSGAALVSGFPYQKTTSVWQRMALPVLFYFLLLAWMPFWFLQRSRCNMPSVAIGQFLFFSAQEYRSIGGHEAVKAKVLEDVWLGIEMAKHRYRQLTLDLSQHVSCHMYREFGSMWDGIARWLYMIASVSAVLFLGIMLVASLLFLAPFLFLFYGLFLAQPAFGWQILVTIQVGILFLARFLAGRRFAQPKSSVLLHPLGVVFLLLVGFYASFRYFRRAGVKWKGRVYEQEQPVK